MVNRFKTLLTENDDTPGFAVMVRSILTVIFGVVLLVAVTQSGILTGEPKFDTLVILCVIALLNGFFIYLANRNILWPGKLFLPVALLLAVTYSVITANGLHDVATLGFPVVIFTSSFLFSRRLLPFWAFVTAVCVGFVGFWDMAGFTPEPIARTTRIDTVTIGILLTLSAAGIAYLLQKRFEEIINKVSQSEREQIETNRELRELQYSLEERITSRTNELQARSQELAYQSQELEKANTNNARRVAQFQAIAEISRAIMNINSLDQLLPEIAKVVSQKMGYYHVGIFLTDDANQYAVLRATNSEGGQRMLNRGHRLRVGQAGIVGNVVGTGLPRVALDTGDDAVHLHNPDLPDTRSEMALPLRTGNQIIGALDVQSIEPNAFSRDDVEVLSTLADQVSIAFQNARLFETTQKSLSEVESLYRQYLRKEWAQTTRKKVAGYRYNPLGMTPVEGVDESKIEQVTSAGKIYEEKGNEASTLVVPISIRGEVIGVLNVQADGGRAWNQDEIDIAQAVAERVAISAENARLFEQTTERAERERKVSEITSKIRSTNDPSEMIQIALNEIRQVLNVKEARIIPVIPPKGTETAKEDA
jgi:GAF domain-containing protein